MSRTPLTDVLRAEANGNDLQPTVNDRVAVIAQRRDGHLYQIGEFDEKLFFTKHGSAQAIIEKIKFGPRNLPHD